jgi:UDP-3-O-[3-hydroxymyristoyl] glucosamine N-acyltransferase
MIFLHIIPPSKRMMNTFIKETRSRFKKDRHVFYFLTKCPESEKILFSYGDVHEIQGKNRYQKYKHFDEMAKQADYIIWHSMTFSPKHVLLFSLPRYLNKSLWIMWGIDLYNWQRPKTTFKNKIVNFINKYWRTHIKRVVALFPLDKQYFQKIFPKSQAEIYDAPYPFSYDTFDTMDSLINWLPRINNRLYVQVAHNSYAFNNHTGIISYLEHFKHENLSLFFPLSYGHPNPKDNEPQIKKVITAANKSFSGKYYAIRKLMPLDEYSTFLWNMDVSVFDAPRQNAIGNIFKQLYMGNKVFLSPLSPIYKFLKDLNIDISNTHDIQKMTFKEFAKRPNPEKAREWIIATYHPEKALKCWDHVFASLGGQNHPESFLTTPPTPKVPLMPIYKDIQTNIYKYLIWPYNIHATTKLIIAGIGPYAPKLVSEIQSVNSKLKQPKFHILGFLDDSENVKNTVPLKSFIGTCDTYNFQDDQLVLCAIENNIERANVFNKLKAKNVVPASWRNQQIIPPQIAFSSASFGAGCIFIGTQAISLQTVIGEGAYMDCCSIDPGCKIGSFVNLTRTTVRKYTSIGSFSKISSSCKIGACCFLGDNATLNEKVSIVNHAHLGTNVFVGSNTLIGLENFEYLNLNNTSSIKIHDCVSIGSKSVINNGCEIGKNSIIGSSVAISKHVKISQQATVGDNSKILLGTTIKDSVEIGFFTNIGSFVNIENNVKIGNAVKIGNHCFIGKNAIIMDGAQIDDFMTIDPGTIVEKGSVVVNPNKITELPTEHLE